MTSSDHLVGPFPEGIDPDAYDRLRRRVLWKMPAGLYLLGSVAGEDRNLMTANLVTQVCMDPKLVGVAVEHSSLSHSIVERGQCFTLGMIARDDRVLARRFVKPAEVDRDNHTLNGFGYFDAPVTGGPVLLSAVAYIDCRVAESLAFGSHTFFVGEVVDAAFTATDTDESPDVLRVEDTRMNYGG